MKKFIPFILIGLFLALPVSPVYADGIIVHPPDNNVTEAEQKALIVHDGTTESLIITVRVEGDAEDFGWIVPVPSQPTVEKASQEIFTVLGEMTEPQKNLLEKLKDPPEPIYRIMEASMGAGALREEAVEVIEEKRVGILDVAILRADDPEALADWLDENGYQLPSENKYLRGRQQINQSLATLQEYIDEGWFFVAAKVNAKFILEDAGKSGGARREIAIAPDYPYYRQAQVTPLNITFKTSRLVYPMKITSLGRGGASVLLYVWSEEKVEVTNYEENYFDTVYAENAVASSLTEWLPSLDDGYLTKLHASYINTTEMKEDLRFSVSDNQDNVGTGEMHLTDWAKLPLYLVVYGPSRLVEKLFSYGGRGISPGGLGLFLGLGAAGVLWGIGFFIFIRRSTNKGWRKILYGLQFPGVWLLANFFSMLLVLVYYFLMSWMGVEAIETFMLNALLANNVGAMVFGVLIYRLQGRILTPQYGSGNPTPTKTNF